MSWATAGLGPQSRARSRKTICHVILASTTMIVIGLEPTTPSAELDESATRWLHVAQRRRRLVLDSALDPEGFL